MSTKFGCTAKYVYIRSTTVYVPSSKLGLSQPLSRQRVCPSPQNWVGTLASGWGSPNTEDWRKSLALCLLCKRHCQCPESVATLPPFSPIEGQKWSDQISSQWESQKNRFALTYFGKIQFLPPCIWNLPFMSTASVKWIRPKLGSFDISSQARRFLEKSAHPPTCESPLKLCRHPVQSLAIRHLIANCAVRRTPLWLRLWFYIIQELANGEWKNSESVVDCETTFFDRHPSFFTRKSHDECSATFLNCAKTVLLAFAIAQWG